MRNYYELLGINSSASQSEIRRAYRILARRYHPDLNPNQQASEKFKAISEAYRVLTDEQKRKEFDRNFAAFQQASIQKKYAAFKNAEAQAAKSARANSYYQNQKKDFEHIKKFKNKNTKPNFEIGLTKKLKQATQKLKDSYQRIIGQLKFYRPLKPQNFNNSGRDQALNKISIIEVSVTMLEAVQGIKKNIEIEESDGIRRIRVQIPAAVRSGSVIRMRSSQKGPEELVLIVKVAHHPFMQIDARGLVVDIPISAHEAYLGASIKVPTLDGDPIMLKIPAGSQSGDELRVRAKGIVEKHDRGDIIYRLLIQLPSVSGDSALERRISELALFYAQAVRQHIPKTLVEAAKLR